MSQITTLHITGTVTRTLSTRPGRWKIEPGVVRENDRMPPHTVCFVMRKKSWLRYHAELAWWYLARRWRRRKIRIRV